MEDMYHNCILCKHFNRNTCGCDKLTEEMADTSFESNVIELVEEGYLSEFLRENILNEIKEYCKTKGRKKSEKEESAEQNALMILEIIEDHLYGYLCDKLATKKADMYIGTDTEFYCKYFE